MELQARTWWFEKKTWNQGVYDGAQLIFWSTALAAFSEILLQLLASGETLANHLGNVFSAIAACVATLGWWQLSRPVEGLDGPKTQVMVLLSRRMTLLWAICAILVAIEWLPWFQTYGQAAFVGRQMGKFVAFTLGLSYLSRVFSHTKHPLLSRSCLALAVLYMLTYAIEFLLVVQTDAANFPIKRLFAFFFEVLVGLLALGVLWQVPRVVARPSPTPAPTPNDPAPADEEDPA